MYLVKDDLALRKLQKFTGNKQNGKKSYMIDPTILLSLPLAS